MVEAFLDLAGTTTGGCGDVVAILLNDMMSILPFGMLMDVSDVCIG